MLKVKKHDGPARSGTWNNNTTPLVIDYKDINFVDNIKTPFKIQKELAQEYVDKTIDLAHNEDNKEKIGVIQGAMYPELRIECANKLYDEGFTTLSFANTDDLQRNPENLLSIIINTRENINPNATLMFPFATSQIIPLLTYIGIDIFDTSRALYEARNNNLMTTTNIYPAEDYNIVDDLETENIKQLEFCIKEVQENIKNGTLRNLTESRATTDPEIMSLHRLLDKNYPEYLQKYTQLY